MDRALGLVFPSLTQIDRNRIKQTKEPHGRVHLMQLLRRQIEVSHRPRHARSSLLVFPMREASKVVLFDSSKLVRSEVESPIGFSASFGIVLIRNATILAGGKRTDKTDWSFYSLRGAMQVD